MEKKKEEYSGRERERERLSIKGIGKGTNAENRSGG